MAKRGFFAEIQHQNKQAAKHRAQQERAYARAHATAVRDAERAQRQAAQAAAQLARATAAQQKAAEREAKRLHEEAQLAKAAARNAELAEAIADLETILAATLDVDDYIDLEELRVVVEHPPFPRKDLEVPTPASEPIVGPAEPVYVHPDAPTGLSAVLGGKRKHEAAAEAARTAYSEAYDRWSAERDGLPELRRRQAEQRAASEERRLQKLKAARDRYEADCKRAESKAEASNRRLDELIAGLRVGEASSVSEYVGIVLGNSVYPHSARIEHDFSFDPAMKELDLTVLLAPPSELPTVKSYRYVKAKDEIVATESSKKDLKERYASFVAQVAVRTLHEVFEADRAAAISTIALVVATEAVDPATGRMARTELVGVGADRQTFVSFDLENVVPLATLQHLGASVSKNPHDLVGIDSAPGVRGR